MMTVIVQWEDSFGFLIFFFFGWWMICFITSSLNGKVLISQVHHRDIKSAAQCSWMTIYILKGCIKVIERGCSIIFNMYFLRAHSSVFLGLIHKVHNVFLQIFCFNFVVQDNRGKTVFGISI